jgi:hypothetical protein
MQFVSTSFNILKVDGSIHVHMLIMWIKTLTHSNINVSSSIVTCVLTNYNKCKMQFISNGFNMLKVDGSIPIPCRKLKICQKKFYPL